jgi:hypothetical protein
MTITSVIPTAKTAIYPEESSRLLILREDMNSPSVMIEKVSIITKRAMYMP